MKRSYSRRANAGLAAFALLLMAAEDTSSLNPIHIMDYMAKRRRKKIQLPHQGERECARRRRQMEAGHILNTTKIGSETIIILPPGEYQFIARIK